MSDESQDSAKRLFIGSPPSTSCLEGILALREKTGVLPIALSQFYRWLDPEQYHLTWLFLGNTSNDKIDEVQGRIYPLQSLISDLALTFDSLEFWPSVSKPQLIVLRALQPSPQCTAVFDALRSAFPEIADHKQWRPHITLARLKKKENPPVSLLKGILKQLVLEPIACQFPTICLYESHLLQTGAKYTSLYELKNHSAATKEH